jgi:hypothetical protein
MDDELSAEERATFAYLNNEDIVVFCSWSEWRRWYETEGDRCTVKFDRIDDWEIKTRFTGCSVVFDGPAHFWEVSFCNPKFSTKAQRHGSKEAALEFHATVVKRIMSENAEQRED